MEDVYRKLKIEHVPHTKLDPNDYNPNRLTDEEFELLLRSIDEDGFTQPIVINQDNVIVDGEHRWRCAHTLGIHSIPCVRVTLTPEEMRVATLRYNKARGHHQADLEAAILEDLAGMGQIDWVIDSLMLAPAALDALLDDTLSMGNIDIDIEVDDLVIESFDPFEDTIMSQYPLVPMSEEDADTVVYDLIIPSEPEPPRYQAIFGYTHADGYIIRHMLGSQPRPRVVEICRRNL